MRARHAEVDDVDQRALPRRCREQLQRVTRHGTVMTRPLDRVLKRAMAAQVSHSLREIALAVLALRGDGAFALRPSRRPAVAPRLHAA